VNLIPQARAVMLGLALAFTAQLAPISIARAAPSFPAPNGTHVVDQANILSPATEAKLDAELTDLESRTSHQVVVATVSSLQGLEIEDYGYQLGRAWKIGREKEDDGVVLLVAPNDRKVRIEVGYGLEPVLTDALSSVIVNQAILPKFKAGDFDGGVSAGTDAIVQQLNLPDDQAKAVAAKAKTRAHDGPPPFAFLILLVVFFVVMSSLRGRRRGGLGGALPWIILGSLGSGGGRDRGGWGGGGFGGGGGFSGGGGSFGGGGSSGSW
jgi:uncharacterized protein